MTYVNMWHRIFTLNTLNQDFEINFRCLAHVQSLTFRPGQYAKVSCHMICGDVSNVDDKQVCPKKTCQESSSASLIEC